MKFQQRLPHTGKETALFILIVSLLSVNIIAPLITCFEIGFSFEHWGQMMHSMPLLWVCIVAFVLLTQKPAEKMAHHFLKDNDNSFEVTMLVTALCNVFLMSVIMTVVGTWVGTAHVSTEPLVHFFEKWPRNYTIAFIVEAFVAQPIARSVMSLVHSKSNAAVTVGDMSED